MATLSYIAPSSQTFKIACLTQLSCAFKISKKWNEKSSAFRNFRWFCLFTLSYEFPESAESRQNFLSLPDIKLVCHFSELKLISNPQNQQKIESV